MPEESSRRGPRRLKEADRPDHDPRWVEVGKRIYDARVKANLTQKELAAMVGVEEKSVSNWQIGKHSPMGHLTELATALNVSRNWLLGDQDTTQVVALLEELRDLAKEQLDQLRLLRLDLNRRN
jgi:transcriptional regulator with XRE-family HTH domain